MVQAGKSQPASQPAHALASGQLKTLAPAPASPLQIIPDKELMLAQLAEYDGRDPDKPLLLSIRGVLYDVSAGDVIPPRSCHNPASQEIVLEACVRAASCVGAPSSNAAAAVHPAGKLFYGPDGPYPFAGHETARAFAKFSTEKEDLTGASSSSLAPEPSGQLAAGEPCCSGLAAASAAGGSSAGRPPLAPACATRPSPYRLSPGRARMQLLDKCFCSTVLPRQPGGVHSGGAGCAAGLGGQALLVSVCVCAPASESTLFSPP